MAVQDQNNDAALTTFANSSSVDAQSSAVTQLIKTRQIFSAFSSAPFQSGIQRLAKASLRTEDQRERLKAIATLEKMRAVLKKRAGQIEVTEREALAMPVESLQFLPEAEDRIYAARALSLARGEWLANYAAMEMVLEVSAEKPRKALAGVLVKTSASLSDVLSLVASNFERWTIREDVLPDSAGRRLRRLVVALRVALREMKIEPGQAIGRILQELTLAPFRAKGPPEKLSVAREITDELASFADDLIHTRVSLALESEIFSFLNVCRRWFPLSSWPQYVTKSKAMRRLSETIGEGIRLSAKQNIIDQRLFDALELATGSREQALQVTTAIADAILGLPAHVQSWLRRGRVEGVSDQAELAEESNRVRADQYVASALLEAETLARKLSSGDDIALGVASYCMALVSAVRSLGSARGMRLFGEPGVTIPFSPSQHAMTIGLIDTRMVRILRQGVERTDLSGNRQVVIKAIVEPVK